MVAAEVGRRETGANGSRRKLSRHGHLQMPAGPSVAAGEDFFGRNCRRQRPNKGAIQRVIRAAINPGDN